MTILERVARLEAIVELILIRVNLLAGYQVQVIFLILGGLAAIAFMVFKNKGD